MKVFICLVVLIAVAYAAAEPPKSEATTELPPHHVPEGGKQVTRDGRYLLVQNRGVYDSWNRDYVVVGSPLYSNYIRSYASSYYI